MGSTGTPDSIRRRQKARSTVSARLSTSTATNGKSNGSSFEPAPGLLRRIQTFPAKPSLLNSPSTPILSRSETYREMASMLDHSYGKTKALLALVPIAVAAGASGLPAAVVFGLNFAALVPVAPLITFAVLSLTKDAGVAGGLLRAVLGNATEMIIGITAMRYGQSQIVQWVVIGSTLSYALFVLGGTFLYSSYKKPEEQFSKTRSGIMSAMVMVVSVCLTVPTIISIADRDSDPRRESAREGGMQANSLFLSQGTALVLFGLFIAYLVFRFRTHGRLFRREMIAPLPPRRRKTTMTTTTTTTDAEQDEEDTEHVTPRFVLALTFFGAIACAVTCANYTIGNMDAVIDASGITKSFVGIVLLPMAGNLAKSVQIIRHSREDKVCAKHAPRRLDFSIRSIMTNILDTLLFITPSLVLYGWATGEPLSLEFGLFEAVVFLLAIVIMTYLVQHGKTTYFEGFMLMGTYISIAVAFYLRPDQTPNISGRQK